MTQELGLVVDLESALKHNPGAQMKLVKDEVKGYRVRQASRRTAEALSAGYWLDILAAHPTEQFLLTAAHAHLNVMLRVYGWPGPADIQVKSMTCANLADHMHRCSHALAKLFDTIRPPEKTSPTRDTFAAWQSPSTSSANRDGLMGGGGLRVRAASLSSCELRVAPTYGFQFPPG